VAAGIPAAEAAVDVAVAAATGKIEWLVASG